jgi:hypothetical protein
MCIGLPVLFSFIEKYGSRTLTAEADDMAVMGDGGS